MLFGVISEHVDFLELKVGFQKCYFDSFIWIRVFLSLVNVLQGELDFVLMKNSTPSPQNNDNCMESANRKCDWLGS